MLHSKIYLNRGILVTGLFLFASSSAVAAPDKKSNQKDFGDYVVHFNTVPTDFLSAKTANRHKITRSRNRILLNIMVKQKQSNKKAKPVKASITAIATNLTGQLRQAKLRPIHDGKGVYYIGEFSVSNREYLKFTVNITPEKQKSTYTLNFRKQIRTR